MQYAGLIVGLGNPGRKYARTRHNIGFMVIDRLLSLPIDSPPSVWKEKGEKREFISWEWTLGDGVWLVIKPLTYMNLSGRAVHKVASKNGFRSGDILVLHDELDLPLGRMKLKFDGGLAGHNGLKSIAGSIGSRDFFRLRLGIGRPIEGQDISRYVLSPLIGDERSKLAPVLEEAAWSVVEFCVRGFDTAVQRTNRFVLPEEN